MINLYIINGETIRFRNQLGRIQIWWSKYVEVIWVDQEIDEAIEGINRVAKQSKSIVTRVQLDAEIVVRGFIENEWRIESQIEWIG